MGSLPVALACGADFFFAMLAVAPSNSTRIAKKGGRPGGRLNKRPVSYSLGLLPSGPDPVGEGHVRRQPPGSIMVGAQANYNPPDGCAEPTEHADPERQRRGRARHRLRVRLPNVGHIMPPAWRRLLPGRAAAGFASSRKLRIRCQPSRELRHADRRFDDTSRSARTEEE